MMGDNQRGDTSVLSTLFAHNTWANLRLLDFGELQDFGAGPE
jgi:hypothetical protein